MVAENEAARTGDEAVPQRAKAPGGRTARQASGSEIASNPGSVGIDTDRLTEAAGERVSELQRLLIEEVRAQPLRALAWAAAAGVIVGLWAARQVVGSLLTQIAATVTAAIKRRVMIYGLWGASGLLVMFAAGYALNAVYTFLMFRWGGITASIAVAGGLLLGAAALALVGHFISMMPQRSAYQSLKASPAISRTTKRLTGPGARRAAASAGAGALAGAVAVFTLAKLRRAAARHSSPDRRRQGPDR